MKILYLTNTNAENINELPNFMRTYGDEVDIYFNKINKEYFAEKKHQRKCWISCGREF